ncbi:LysR substrate-binding domain-containing protein [Acuticoccus sp. I52.16.1]|uniref:LysR substrate-binding domain-containing protein n=1 Tax=Acuticoccus sp. I52.16.1 TaxID=2928472 RepID=UPI001FD3C436|nr:LysR substrate-binding domain-containing protein [Acuticoccus sp. I52.16.1]UOM33199.1 LysR substrate-binding domain-containing protein [Acuticoccus sp. I52.16.1]
MSTNILESDLIRTFVAVCEEGSFRAAAERVNRTPSAVSMQMAKLEEQVRHPIFRKNGRSVALTPTGAELLGYARRILLLNEEAMARFQCESLAGVVRIGVTDDYETRLLPAVLSRFARLHPDANIEVVMATTLVLVDKAANGEVDLAFVEHNRTRSLTAGEVIHAEPFLWIGRRGGTAATRRPLPIAVPGVGCFWRHTAEEALERAAIPHRVAFSCEYSHGQIAAVEADLAVAPLPASYLGPALERVPVAAGLPDLGVITTNMCIAPTASPAARALAAVVRETLATKVDTRVGDTFAARPGTRAAAIAAADDASLDA